jgi:hypothetical protein
MAIAAAVALERIVLVTNPNFILFFSVSGVSTIAYSDYRAKNISY